MVIYTFVRFLSVPMVLAMLLRVSSARSSKNRTTQNFNYKSKRKHVSKSF